MNPLRGFADAARMLQGQGQGAGNVLNGFNALNGLSGSNGLNGVTGNPQNDQMGRIRDLLQKNRQITGQTQTGNGSNNPDGQFSDLLNLLDQSAGSGRTTQNGRNRNQSNDFDPFRNLLSGLQQNDDEKLYDDSTDDEQDDDDDDDDDGFVSMKTTLEKVGLSRYTMTLMSNGIETTEQLMTMDTEMVAFIIPNVRDREKLLDFVRKNK